MRTTVNIDDHLLTAARELAARTHRPLGAVVDDALRVLIAGNPPAKSASPVRLPVDGGSGLQPGVDLDDKEALAEVLGENRLRPDAGR